MPMGMVILQTSTPQTQTSYRGSQQSRIRKKPMGNIKNELCCKSTDKMYLEIISILNLHLYKHLNIKPAPLRVCRKKKNTYNTPCVTAKGLPVFTTIIRWVSNLLRCFPRKGTTSCHLFVFPASPSHRF